MTSKFWSKELDLRYDWPKPKVCIHIPSFPIGYQWIVSALRRYGFQLDKTPVPGCQTFTFGSDNYWECAVRRQTGPENHQAGSCKMGPNDDPMAVVDPQLRVRFPHSLWWHNFLNQNRCTELTGWEWLTLALCQKWRLETPTPPPLW